MQTLSDTSSDDSRKRRRIALDVFLFCLLFFCVIQLPYWPVTDLHDQGAEAAIEYWTMHHYQYGTEIVQNVGPLGFINYPRLYTGFLDTEKCLINIALTVSYLLLVLYLLRKIPDRVVKAVLFVNVALFSSTWLEFSGYMNADARLYLFTLLIVYALFLNDKVWLTAWLALGLALLSLAKGSLLFAALPAIAGAGLYSLLSRKPGKAVTLGIAYVSGLILFWSACGQRLAHLPDFLRETLGLGHGYASAYVDAMGLFENEEVTWTGVVTLIIAAWAIASRHFANSGPGGPSVLHRCCRALPEGFILFIIWKHGFVRADGHTLTFFYVLSIASIFFFWLPEGGSGVAGSSFRRMFFIAQILLCYTGMFLSTKYMGTPYPDGHMFYPEVVRNVQFLKNRGTYFPDLHERFESAVAEFSLPRTRARVGHEGIGYFGFRVAPMLYNDFDYRPMPNTISFTGWSRESMENDAAFFRNDASAPPYLLYTQDTVDARLPAQDDALAQMEILHHYEPVVDRAIQKETDTRILLRRVPAMGDLTRAPTGKAGQFKLDEWVDVPRTDEPVWLKTQMPRSFAASLMRAAYKPPAYVMEYQLSDGSTNMRWFVPRMAEVGFLAGPLINNNLEFLMAYDAREMQRYRSDASTILKRIVRFRITCLRLDIACADHIDVAFETVRGLNLGRLGGGMAP